MFRPRPSRVNSRQVIVSTSLAQRGARPPSAIMPLRAWHECRRQTHRRRAPRCQLRGTASRPPTLYPCGDAKGCLRARCERHAGDPRRICLGRHRHGLRLRFQEVRRLGPKPHDRMAWPLRWLRSDDLLARRKACDLHLFAAQALLLVGGRLDDRGRAATLHGHGDPAAICRQSRSERRRLRLLPPPWV